MNESTQNNAIDDTFIQDIRYTLHEINETQQRKCNEINDHFKNISSNPEHSYSKREQIAVLLEIMNCYNTNITEYQKNMRELGKITKNLIKAHSNRSLSDESHTSDETIRTGSSSTLYDYFLQLVWGKPAKRSAVEPGKEPTLDFANIFVEQEPHIIEHNIAKNASEIFGKTPERRTPPSDLAKKKRRNTIQPIIKHIPHM